MSAIKNISLFVPHVFPNFTQKYVVEAFADLGDVDRVDFVAKQDRDGKQFNAAYIHFKRWHDNRPASVIQDNIANDGSSKFYHDDSEYYWIVLPNTAKKYVPGDRKPRIDLGESKSVSVKPVEKTPEKQVKEVVCPGAPKKPSYAQVADKTTKPTKSVGELVAEFEEWYTNTVEFSSVQQRELDALVERKELCNVVQRVRNQDLTAIAELETELYLACQVPLGRVMEDIDIIRSIDDNTNSNNATNEASEDAAQMAEIEAELEAEDENLVSIDWRYVQAIEQENMGLHAEIAQLRMALINLDQMYKAEAAKVRAFSNVETSVDL